MGFWRVRTIAACNSISVFEANSVSGCADILKAYMIPCVRFVYLVRCHYLVSNSYIHATLGTGDGRNLTR